MPIEITMPRLSDTMEEGTLIKWRVKVGDKVQSGDLLADIETDKATMELQAYDDGTVARLVVEEGQVTPIGTLIMVLAQDGESTGAAGASAAGSSYPEQAAAVVAVQPTVATDAVTAVSVGSVPRIRATPVARRIAEEHGIDLQVLKGTGPDGHITKRDVQAALGEVVGPTTATTPVPVVVASTAQAMASKTIPLSNMRKTIARRLVESKTTIPHFAVTVTVRMDPLLDLRRALNTQLDSQGIKLSVNDFVVRASALALTNHPSVNSSWSDSAIEQHGAVNVGVAIAIAQEKGGGLVVATIRHADRKTLRQINVETRSLAQKARGQGLSLEDMADGTFTVSNLGMFGVEHFEAIINPPQAAILAVGSAVQRPVVCEGHISVGHEMTVTLSADHRVIDGAMAAEFLHSLRQMLENPALIMI